VYELFVGKRAYGPIMNFTKLSNYSGLLSREFLSRINLVRRHRFAVGRFTVHGFNVFLFLTFSSL